MTEKEYRKIKRNSSSSLKEYSLDRRKYYKKYVLNEKVEEKPNKASDMGRLVETLLMEPDRFDDMFFMSSLASPPGAMLGDFVYELAVLVSKHTDEDDVLKADFNDLCKEAYKKAGFKIKFETVVKKLENPEVELYYKELLNVIHKNMTLVTPQDIDNAEKIVFELKNNPNTASIINLETNKTWQVINQMKIQFFMLDGMELKAMLDKVIINHDKKEIHIYDLKCTWSVEGFYKEYYLYRRAYIQGYVYYKAVEYITNISSSDLYGYKVHYPKFIVCDSINYFQPLIYVMHEFDIADAYNGFERREKKYPGVKQIIEELKWSLETDIWNISKTNYDNNGVVNINNGFK